MVKAKQLTPEQQLMGDIQRLQSSKGWSYVVKQWLEDKTKLEQELRRYSTKIRTQEEIIDINYIGSKIELIEDMINMPKQILEEFDPIIDTDTPDT